MKTVSVRHPMPYGDLAKQKVQRFAAISDLKKHDCTIEEMEEYEPHISRGNVIYAGVDYEAILREAEKEADIIIWDGGNNDMSFYPRLFEAAPKADPDRLYTKGTGNTFLLRKLVDKYPKKYKQYSIPNKNILVKRITWMRSANATG